MPSIERATTVPNEAREAEFVQKARQSQKMNLRVFGEALGVSHNAVAMWENGERAVDEERIRAWLVDPRPWVKQLGFTLFMDRHGDTLAEISASIAAFSAGPRAA